MGLVALLSAIAYGQSAAGVREPGHTAPSERSEHTLRVVDIVWEILVKPGDRVRKGQELLIEDDREEQIKYQIMKLEAESEADIKAAQAKLAEARMELARLEKILATNVASVQEVEKAKLAVQLGEAEVDKAHMQHRQAGLQAEQQAQLLKEMRLIAKIDGVVEKVDVKVGEAVDPNKPAITVVNNDLLWVEFVTTANTLDWDLGKELEVYYKGERQPRQGKVIFLSPVVDKGSQRRLVRLEMPNPEGRPAGMMVEVALPARVADAQR